MKKLCRFAHVPVWAPKMDWPGICLLLGDKTEALELALHYVHEDNRSFICEGEALCQDHRRPLNMKHYLPIMLFKKVVKVCPTDFQREYSADLESEWWLPKVLEVTSCNWDTLMGARAGILIHASRPGGNHRNRPFFQRLPWDYQGEAADYSFSVEAHVRRVLQASTNQGKQIRAKDRADRARSQDDDGPATVLFA